MSGDAAANYLDGDEGNDALDGRDGDDRSWEGRATTLCRGPGGFDRVDFRIAAPMEIDFSIGRATGEGTDSLDGIEGAGASKRNDVLIGDAATNYFAGRGGADRIVGGDGDDFMHGGPGRDSGDGGPGKDACKSFETTKKNCERKNDPPSHPLEKSVGTTGRTAALLTAHGGGHRAAPCDRHDEHHQRGQVGGSGVIEMSTISTSPTSRPRRPPPR